MVRWGGGGGARVFFFCLRWHFVYMKVTACAFRKINETWIIVPMWCVTLFDSAVVVQKGSTHFKDHRLTATLRKERLENARVLTAQGSGTGTGYDVYWREGLLIAVLAHHTSAP